VIVRLIAVLTLFVALASRLSAECGLLPPTCDALENATLVFYGEVTTMRFTPNYAARNEQSTDGRQEVTFDVLQAFKGVERGIFTGTFNFSSETISFKPGTRYVVYATRRNGRWDTGCSPTTEVSNSAASVVPGELTRLRACRQ
jgi:hypothetical protein